MISKFQSAAEAVGAHVQRFDSPTAAAAYVRKISGGSVAASPLPDPIRVSLEGVDFIEPEDFPEAKVGLSFALAGIASTGSLLLELSDTAGRTATALPLIHMVYLRASSIVPEMNSLAGAIDDLLSSRPHAYLSLTTGPSRTADIERVLTIGVHGPEELHILILEGE